MDGLLNWLGEIVRWTGPLIALVISAAAWRRFRSPGSYLVVLGLLLVFASPLTRTIVFEVWVNDSTLRATDVGTILTVVGMISGIGMIVLVFAIRRLIAAAQVAESSLGFEDDRS